jgi:hypothetical protein
MKAMKIGSKVTYTTTLQELDEFKYINYSIQERPKRSIIEMVRFDTETTKNDTTKDKNGPEDSNKNTPTPDPESGHINKKEESLNETKRNKEDQSYNESDYLEFFSN